MTKPSFLPDSPDTPLKIYYSVPKLLVWDTLLTLFALLWIGGIVNLVLKGQRRIDGDFWLMVGFGVAVLVILVLPFTVIVLRGLARPVLTISREGLSFAGRPLIPWPQIEGTSWKDNIVSSAIHVKLRPTEGKRLNLPLVVHSRFFKCSGEQYLRSCDFYRGVEIRPQYYKVNSYMPMESSD